MVRFYKDNALKFAGITIAVNFEDCIKQLRYYFANINKVRGRNTCLQDINTPYVIFQRDRRKKDIPVGNDWRRHFKYI